MKKFFNFVQTKTSNDLYLYGSIVSPDDKWDESDVTFEDFKNKIDELQDNSVLNIYQNSPGGDCFACSSMVSLLNRAKDRGITINAYIDGLSASCSSWISCVADNLFIYPNSIMMVHKPMSFAFGNASEMQKEIEVLDKIQNDVMLPLYMNKSKEGVTKEQIMELVDNETWLSANEILEYFDATLLEEKNKKVACCTDKELFKMYKNVPKDLLDSANKEVNNMSKENKNNEKPIVNKDEKDNKIVNNEQEIEVTNLKEQLKNANNKILSLTDKITEMQSMVDDFKALKETKQKEEKQKKLNEKREYFKNKFDKLGARDKFETDEVQGLINNCLDDVEAMTKLSNIIFDLVDNIKTEDKVVAEQPSNIDNLLDEINTGAKAYGFK